MIPSPEIADRLIEIAPTLKDWLAINRDEKFSIAQIEKALAIWLERSMEALLDEAVYHCVSGTAVHAVGRHDFQSALRQVAK